jgi:hypothetical protein
MDALPVGRCRAETAHPIKARSVEDGALITAAHPATPYRAALASLIEEAVRLVGLSNTVFVGLDRGLFFGGRRRGRHYLPIPSVSLHWGVCSARAEMGGAL